MIMQVVERRRPDHRWRWGLAGGAMVGV